MLSNLSKVTPLLSGWAHVYVHICPTLEVYAKFITKTMGVCVALDKRVNSSPDKNFFIKCNTDSYPEDKIDWSMFSHTENKMAEEQLPHGESIEVLKLFNLKISSLKDT